MVAVGPRDAFRRRGARERPARVAAPARRRGGRTSTSTASRPSQRGPRGLARHARRCARRGAAARAARRWPRPSRTRRALRATWPRPTWRGRCCCSCRGRCAATRRCARCSRAAAGRGLPVRRVQRLGTRRAGRLPRAGVPTVAIQHGILYPKYYSYRHEPDEARLPAARPHGRVRRGRAALPDGAGPLPAELAGRDRQPQVRRPARAPRARGTAPRCARGWASPRASACWWWPAAIAAIRDTHQSIGSAFARARAGGGGAARGAAAGEAAPGGAGRGLRGRPARGGRRARRASLPAGADLVRAAARGRRAGHRGVALGGGGAGAGPAGAWC